MIRLDIDLRIAEASGDEGAADAFEATVTAAGSEVVVFVSDPSRLPGNGRRTLHELNVLAKGLADRGISVRLDGPQGAIIALGEVKTSALQRLISGSPHIRLGSPSALAPLLTRRRDREAKTIPPPPLTLLPLAPTLNRRVRRQVTTTHYTFGSGRPRLIFAQGSGPWDGRPPREFDLLPERTRIGSGADADLVLPGLEKLHAEIRHESDDEYVLYSFGPTGGGSAAEPGREPAKRRVLRTGARIELGTWRLAFFRAEFADHGRPFGGRQGGEYAIQRPQPPRPYASDPPSISPQG